MFNPRRSRRSVSLQFSLILKGLRHTLLLVKDHTLMSAVFPDTEGIETLVVAWCACAAFSLQFSLILKGLRLEFTIIVSRLDTSAVFPDTEGIETCTE